MIKANEAKRRPPGTDPVVVVDLRRVGRGGAPRLGAAPTLRTSDETRQ